MEEEKYISPKEGWDSQRGSEMEKSIGVLLDDEVVTNNQAEVPIWAFATKSCKLTFLEKWEVPIFESHFESMVCNYLMSLSPCMIDDSTIQRIAQIRSIMQFNLRRSSGTDNTNKLNERTALVTQISQSITSGVRSGSSGGASPKRGLIKRMFGMG